MHHEKPANKWVCELCFPDLEEIGEFVPGYWLAYDPKNGFVLISGEGHTGDIVWRFHQIPRSDPDPDLKHFEGPLGENADRWIDEAEEFCPLKTLTLIEAMVFVPSIYEAGFQKNGHKITAHWLWNRAGAMIEKWKHATNRIP